MKSFPLVSICIPVYNCERYIAEAINSALNQDYPNIEIIVIDNNSSDDSAKIADQFVPMGIKVFRNSNNIGMGGNWNKCLRKSNGEFIKILPADDFIASTCISEQLDAFRGEFDQISFVACSRRVVDQNGKYLLKRVNNDLKNNKINSKKEVLELIFKSATNIIGEPGAVLLKRDAVINCGDFRESSGFLIDLDYWVRMLDFGNLLYIDRPISTFRINPGSDSVRIIDKQAADASRFFKTLYKLNSNISLGLYLRSRIGIYINVLIKFIFYKLFLRID